MVELIWEELKEFILGWYYSDKHCHLFKKYSKKTTTFCLQWGGGFRTKTLILQDDARSVCYKSFSASREIELLT